MNDHKVGFMPKESFVEWGLLSHSGLGTVKPLRTLSLEMPEKMTSNITNIVHCTVAFMMSMDK